MRLRGKEAAAEVLTLIGEQGGDPMMAQLGMMLALNRRRPKPTPAPRRKPAKVRAAEFVAGKMHALEGHASQLGHPAGIPPDEHWWALPKHLLDTAADSVELFVPWRPPKPRS